MSKKGCCHEASHLPGGKGKVVRIILLRPSGEGRGSGSFSRFTLFASGDGAPIYVRECVVVTCA